MLYLFGLTAIIFGAMFLARIVMAKSEKEKREQYQEQQLKLLRAIDHKLGAIYLAELEIRDFLRNPKLTSARTQIMPKTVKVGETAQATIQGFDQNGNPFPLDASYKVSYAASSPADVSVGPVNPDGSATITAVAADPGDQIGATIERPDGVMVSASADILVIEAPPPPVAVLTTANVVLN